MDMFRHFTARFLPQICLQILEHKGYAHEDQTGELHLAMDSFFPKISRDTTSLLRSARCASGPKDLWAFLKIDLGFRWL